MTNQEIVREIEKLCRERGTTSDPNKIWELDLEIERLYAELEV